MAARLAIASLLEGDDACADMGCLMVKLRLVANLCSHDFDSVCCLVHHPNIHITVNRLYAGLPHHPNTSL